MGMETHALARVIKMRGSKLLGLLGMCLWSMSLSFYDGIAITINDRVVTKNEIDIRALQISQQMKATSRGEQGWEQARSIATELLIEEALLDSRADELMIYIGEEELDEEIDRHLRSMRLSPLEFEELLDRQKTTLVDYRRRFREKMRRDQVVSREIRAEISIEDQKLKRLFEEGAGRSIQVRARHILLRLNNNPSDAEIESSRSRIEAIRQEILAGKSFVEMADRYSEDPSVKRNHGDLGFFGKEDMVKEFSEVAFRLEPGTVSEPFRSPLGFHILEVIEKRSLENESFAEVREKLYQQEYQKVFSARYREYLAGLKQKAQIVYRKDPS